LYTHNLKKKLIFTEKTRLFYFTGDMKIVAKIDITLTKNVKKLKQIEKEFLLCPDIVIIENY